MSSVPVQNQWQWRCQPHLLAKASLAILACAAGSMLAQRRYLELGASEIASLEAEVRALTSEAEQSEGELSRQRALLEQAIATTRDLERQLEELEAAAGVESAQAELAAARARLTSTELRASVTGRVLEILTLPGETVGSQPILRLGEIDRMYAVAEVDETDVRWLAIGQRAQVESPHCRSRSRAPSRASARSSIATTSSDSTRPRLPTPASSRYESASTRALWPRATCITR